LLPGTRTAAIHARLRTASLDESLQFEALSYRWGSDSFSESITLNDGHVHPVTASAFAALQSLRYKRGRARTLWVDAICIDQANEQEKVHQVLLMGDIYRSATVVNVWLGSSKAVAGSRPSGLRYHKLWTKMCREFRSDIRAPTLDLSADQTEARRLAAGQAVSNVRATLRLAQHAFRGRHEALAEVLKTNLPWHERAWIVQEYLLAKRVQFGFGAHWVTCDVAGLLSWVDDGNEAIESFRTALGFNFEGVRLSMSDSDTGNLSLSALQNILRTQQCKDPRDKLYCLLSFLDPFEKSLIPVDYTMPCWKVFAQATYAMVRSQATFRVLDMASLTQPSQVGFPTWAVDFANFPREGKWEEGFPANEDLATRREQMSARCVLSEGCDILQIKAVPFDVVGVHTLIQAPSKVAEVDKPIIGIVMSAIALNQQSSVIEPMSNLLAAMLCPTVDAGVMDLVDDAEISLRVQKLMSFLQPPAYNVRATVRDAATNVVTDTMYLQIGRAPSESTGEAAGVNHVQTACLLWESLTTPLDLQRQGKIAVDVDDAKAFLPLCTDLYTVSKETAGGLSFFGTVTGMVGVAPFGIHEGDLIVLADPESFLVLRPRSGEDAETAWQFKGRALVYSMHTADPVRDQFLQERLDETPTFTLC
jgi:hypothetical protein